MKSTVAIAALSGALLSAAQTADTMPACGQTCLDNMGKIMQETYGCAAGNQTCYCSEANYGFGIRDCANQYCGDANLAMQSLYFGAQLCLNQPNAAAGSESSFGSPSNSSAVSGLPSVSDGARAGSTAITTSALVTTITTDGSTVVSTTGSSTIFGAVSSGAAATGSTGTDASGSVTTGSSSTGTRSETTRARTTTSTSESSNSEGAAAAMKTQAPLLGAVALAAIALL